MAEQAPAHEDKVATEAEDERMVIRVSGAFTRDTSTIGNTGMNLVTAIGSLNDDSRVLVPFAECWIGGTFGHEDSKQIHTVRLSFDNVTFVLNRLATALGSDYVPWLAAMSAGELRLPDERVRYMIDNLRAASGTLAQAAERLNVLLSDRASENNAFTPGSKAAAPGT